MAETINTPKKITNLLLSLLVASFIVGIDGIYQKIAGFDFFRKFPLFNDIKVSATFKFSNDFGTYLAAVLPIPVSLFIYKSTEKKTRLILFILCLILGACLLLTQARAAWLGFILGLGFICLFCGRKNFLIIVVFLIILAVLAGLFAPALIKEEIKSVSKLGSDISSQDRIIILKTAWKMFIDKPFFGHGLNTFMRVFSLTKPKDYDYIVYAHNCYIQMAAETGIFGLIFFSWIIFSFMRNTMSIYFRTNEKFIKGVTMGIMSGIIAYLINSLFDTCLYSLPLAVLFWSLAGLAAARFQTE